MTTYNEALKHAQNLKPQLGDPDWLMGVLVQLDTSGSHTLMAIVDPEADLAKARATLPDSFNGIPVTMGLTQACV